MVSLTTNISTLRIQVEGQGSTNHRLLDERRELDAQVKALMAEMVPMREQALLYAASSQLRPEMESLQRDYNTVLIEKRSLLEEVQRLRFHDKQLQDLRTELEKVRQSTDSLSSPGNMSASQRHVMWTGIPALRQASPLLYDNIRSLFQDLFNKEAECRDLATQVKRFQDDQSYRDDDYRTDYQKMAEMEDRMNRRAAEDHSCIDTMERELVRARGARLAVEQLRSVLRSALGNATADYLRPPCIPNSRNNTPATQRRVGRQFRDPHDEELNGSSGAYEFDESFSIKKNEDLMNSSLEALAVAEIHEHVSISQLFHKYLINNLFYSSAHHGLITGIARTTYLAPRRTKVCQHWFRRCSPATCLL